ncbi:unnamed protein product [Blepharisma stoltei]|uniref:IPO4/5-like TPR repeats domain-containing protein n=1 Tax=Blepharisma stoltei TaxID=1481888 RepID=A0AAU9JJT7_9CILI|nr:unnamed protein product [Blepharisma stoltei]
MEQVTEAEIQEVSQLLAGVLASNNTFRKQCEAQYNAALQQQPGKLFMCLVYNLNNTDLSVKTLSSILLKKLVAPITTHDIWNKLPLEVQNLAKQMLLDKISNEENRKIREHICEVVGLLGSNILISEGKNGTWDELLPFIYRSLEASGQLRVSALEVLATLFPYLFDQFMDSNDKIFQVFKVALNDEDISTRSSCLKAVNSLLSIVDTATALYYKDLVPDILKSIDYILSIDLYTGNKSLELLRELVDSEPKIFKPSILHCFELIHHLCNKQGLDISSKNLALEFIVCVCERMPKVIHQNVQLAVQTISKIMEMMVGIDQEIDEAWKVPEEGFQDKDDEEGDLEMDYAKIGRRLISRLIEAVGDRYLLDPTLGLIQQALSAENDWRMTYVALMALSEILNYISEPEKITELVHFLTIFSKSQNPKVRYAVFHLIGEASQDYPQEFQSSHHEKIYPILVEGLNDSTPRVVAHCCLAISKFIRDAGISLASSYAVAFIPKLITFLSQNCPSIVVEQSCTAIAAIATSCKDYFKDDYIIIMPYLLSLFEKYKEDYYKTLRGRVIECIMSMSKNVEKEVFMLHAEPIINIMKNMQEGDLENSDQLVGYLLSGWQRICEIMESDFSGYLDEVVPGLIQMVDRQMEIHVYTNPDSFVDIHKELGEQKATVSTTITENKELAMQTLLSFVTTLKGQFSKYIDSVVRVAVPMMHFHLNESVRGAAASLLAGLIEVKFLSGEQNAVQDTMHLSQVFLKLLWHAVEEEYVCEAETDQLKAIKKIIDITGVPYLTQTDVTSMGEKLIKLLQKSIQNRNVAQNSDEEEDEAYNEYRKGEEDNLHTAISEVLGVIFKTQKEKSLPIINYLMTNTFPKLLSQEALDEDHKLVIFILDDIIEFLGQNLIKDYWNAIGEVLVKFATDTNDAVRQAACYGLGIFAANTSPEGFKPWVPFVISAIEKSLQVACEKNTKSHGYARDNAVAAMGRVIKFQHMNLDMAIVVPAFIELLPIKFDKMEAKYMNDVLADLVISSENIALGENGERMLKVLHILSDALETKYIEAETTGKIKEILMRLNSRQSAVFAEAWRTLRDSQQVKINRLISGK